MMIAEFVGPPSWSLAVSKTGKMSVGRTKCLQVGLVGLIVWG